MQLKKLVWFKTKNSMIITDTPGTPFEKIAMDIVRNLPITSSENRYNIYLLIEIILLNTYYQLCFQIIEQEQ